MADLDPKFETRAELPLGAGICAYDLDECTITVALNNASEVKSMLHTLPAKNRVTLAHSHLIGEPKP